MTGEKFVHVEIRVCDGLVVGGFIPKLRIGWEKVRNGTHLEMVINYGTCTRMPSFESSPVDYRNTLLQFFSESY